MKTFLNARAATLCTAMLLSAVLTRAQIITTVAGNGTSAFGGDGAAATAAQLNNPRGITFDAAGNMYIADTDNDRIRKVDAVTGVITTFAGTGVAGNTGDGGQATAAQLNKPYGIVFDRAGNLYIADVTNSRVRRIRPTGVIEAFAGTGSAGYTGDGGPALNAKLNFPSGIAVDAADNIYITNAGSSVVRKVDAVTGIISTVAGTGTSGYSGDGSLATTAQLRVPHSSYIDAAGNIYIADQFNCVARKVNTSGIISTIAGSGTCGLSGNGGAATSADMLNPTGIVMDGSGTLYITNYNWHVVRAVNSAGIISTVAGNGNNSYSGDGGPATSAALSHPYALAIGPDGNLYISDQLNSRIRKVTLPVCTTADAGSIVSSNGTTFCGNDSTLLTLSAGNSGSGITYLWQSSADGITWNNAGTQTALQTHAPANPVYYKCIVTCASATISDTTPVLHITPQAAEQPGITISANPGTVISSGTTVTFTATPSNAGTNPTYQWQRNTIDIPGETSNTYTTNNLANNTVITCKIYSDAACRSADSTFSNVLLIQVTTGLGNLSADAAILLYPNPSSGMLYIQGEIAGTSATIQVLNLMGQVIYGEETRISNGKLNAQLTLPASCSNGWYLLRVQSESAQYRQPFTLKR